MTNPYIGIMLVCDPRARIADSLVDEGNNSIFQFVSLLEDIKEIEVKAETSPVNNLNALNNFVENNNIGKLSGLILIIAGKPSEILLSRLANMTKSPILLVPLINNKGQKSSVFSNEQGIFSDTMQVCSILREYGSICISVLSFDNIKSDVRSFCKAAQLIWKFRELTILSIGRNEIRNMSSIISRPLSIINIDIPSLVGFCSKIDNDKIYLAIDWLKENIEQGFDYTNDIIFRSVRYAIGLKELARETHSDCITISCVPELAELYGTLCLARALVNNDFDFDGPKRPVPTCCNADIAGALSCWALYELSGKPVFSLPISEIAEDGYIRTFSCGGEAPYFASTSHNPYDSYKKVGIVFMDKHLYPADGASLQFNMITGTISCARFNPMSKDKPLFWTKSHIVDSFSELNTRNIAIRSEMDTMEFTRTYPSGILHGVLGDYSSELELTNYLIAKMLKQNIL